jgi:DNA polymerase-4
MIRTVLHADLDAFFVAVEQARDPALRGKPVIVGGEPGGRGVVATASYEARAFGVSSGMALRTAQRLAPHAIFVRGNFDAYVDASRTFHRILGDFTPLVESGGLDEAWLDITGCEAICGTPLEAAASIRARVRSEIGIAASVGIGVNKMVAKVAADQSKPDGLLEVRPGTEAAFLAPLPLRNLPMLGPTLEKRLHRLGVKTLGEVAALPPSVLTSLFGRQGRILAQRCRGIDATPVGGRPGQKSVSREGTFWADVADLRHLRAVLRGFSESVGAELRSQKRRGSTVSLRLRYGDLRTVERSRTSERPFASDDDIYDAAEKLLDELRARDPSAVRRAPDRRRRVEPQRGRRAAQPRSFGRGAARAGQRRPRWRPAQVRAPQPPDWPYRLRPGNGRG